MLLMPRLASCARALVPVLLAVGAARASGADKIEACKPSDIDAFDQLRERSLGVAVQDRSPWLAPEIVVAPGLPPEQSCPTEVDFASDQNGRATDGLHDWVFASPCKVTACGEPVSFEQNRSFFWFSGEYDLNTNIEIEDDFRSRFLNRQLCYPPVGKKKDTSAGSAASPEPNPEQESFLLARQDPRLCFAPTDTLHAEITPDPRLRPLLRKAWTDDWPYGWIRWRDRLTLTRPPVTSEECKEEPLSPALKEKCEKVLRPRVCVYGPFVADTGHGARAEIHPVQVYWWKERETPDSAQEAPGPGKDLDRLGRIVLLMMQDASGRYSKAHDFLLSRRPGSGWRPWAEAPVDATVTVPFWSNPADPPRFRLEPYDYLDVPPGAPQSVACHDEWVVALTGAQSAMRLAGTDEVTVASICESVTARHPSRIKVDVHADCYCDPGVLGAACPGNGQRPWILGRIVLRAETGRRRDWSEGSLAMVLTDERPPSKEGAALPVATGVVQASEMDAAKERRQTVLAELETVGRVSGIVSWKPAPGTRWERVEPRAEDIPRTPSVIDRLFDEAHWPEGPRRPIPSLWRLEAVELNADATIERLTEKQRKSKKVDATFFRATATPLLPGPGRELGADPVQLGEHRAQLALPTENVLDLRRVDVPTKITVSYKDRDGKRQERDALPPGQTDPIGHWTLWTHALGGSPSDDWHRAVRALCDHFVAGQLQGGSAPVALPMEDLRTIVQRTVKDGLVTVTELTSMVQSVGELCGSESQTPRTLPIEKQMR